MPHDIDCFDKVNFTIKGSGGQPVDIKDEFEARVKADPNTDPRTIGKKLAKEVHEQLHGEANALKSDMTKANPSRPQNISKYKAEDFSKKEQEINDKYNAQINEIKSGIPEPPESEGGPTATGTPEGTRISKQGVFEQYGKQFEKTPVGWDDITKGAISDLYDRSRAAGTTVEAQAKNEVDAMLDDLHHGKLKADEKDIAIAAFHLMNQDSHIDDLSGQTPGTTQGRQALALELLNSQKGRDLTLKLIDAMGSKFGRALGMYAGVFSKDADGGIKATRTVLSGIFGHDMPMTEKELDENKNMSNKDKEKIRPYVKKLEEIKAAFDAAKKTQKATGGGGKSKPKATDNIRSLADKIRNSQTLEDWGLGKPIKGHTQGFTLNIKETVADALVFIADQIDKGVDLAKAISEAAKQHKGANKQEDFEGLLNHIMDQHKPLEQPSTVPFDVNEDAKQARVEWQRRQTIGQLKALEQNAIDQNKSWIKQSLDWRRGFIIGGLRTVIRVGISGVGKYVIDPISRLTTGNVAALLPGLGERAVSPDTIIEGLLSAGRFKNNQEAIDFANQKQAEFAAASKALEKNPDDHATQEAYMKAEMENAKADVYRYINGNIFADSKELAKYGSTDFEEAMGGYAKIDPTILRGANKGLYYLSTLARLHGVEKQPSARRAMITEYNNKLLEYQKKGVPLSASTRMRALDMAYVEFMSGKYQNKTWVSDRLNEWKYRGDRPGAKAEDVILSTFLQAAVPVAKVPINIVKLGVDMSTLGTEGVLRYMWQINKNAKLNAAEGKAYDSVWAKLIDAAKDIPEKDKAYIHNILQKGLFGAGLMAYAAWGVKNGSIRYGGSYQDGRDKVKYKGADGEWHDDLEYGQWVIAGHKFGKDASKVLNHLPEFLPIAMVVNTHNVYQYEHTYPGASGERKLHDGNQAFWDAMKSDLNEVTEKLPFQSLAKPGDILQNAISLPMVKDVSDYFDTDAQGHKIIRKPNGLLQHLAYGIGWNSMVDKKKPKE